MPLQSPCRVRNRRRIGVAICTFDVILTIDFPQQNDRECLKITEQARLSGFIGQNSCSAASLALSSKFCIRKSQLAQQFGCQTVSASRSSTMTNDAQMRTPRPGPFQNHCRAQLVVRDEHHSIRLLSADFYGNKLQQRR